MASFSMAGPGALGGGLQTKVSDVQLASTNPESDVNTTAKKQEQEKAIQQKQTAVGAVGQVGAGGAGTGATGGTNSNPIGGGASSNSNIGSGGTPTQTYSVDYIKGLLSGGPTTSGELAKLEQSGAITPSQVSDAMRGLISPGAYSGNPNITQADVDILAKSAGKGSIASAGGSVYSQQQDVLKSGYFSQAGGAYPSGFDITQGFSMSPKPESLELGVPNIPSASSISSLLSSSKPQTLVYQGGKYVPYTGNLTGADLINAYGGKVVTNTDYLKFSGNIGESGFGEYTASFFLPEKGQIYNISGTLPTLPQFSASEAARRTGAISDIAGRFSSQYISNAQQQQYSGAGTGLLSTIGSSGETYKAFLGGTQTTTSPDLIGSIGGKTTTVSTPYLLEQLPAGSSVINPLPFTGKAQTSTFVPYPSYVTLAGGQITTKPGEGFNILIAKDMAQYNQLIGQSTQNLLANLVQNANGTITYPASGNIPQGYSFSPYSPSIVLSINSELAGTRTGRNIPAITNFEPITNFETSTSTSSPYAPYIQPSLYSELAGTRAIRNVPEITNFEPTTITTTSTYAPSLPYSASDYQALINAQPSLFGKLSTASLATFASQSEPLTKAVSSLPALEVAPLIYQYGIAPGTKLFDVALYSQQPPLARILAGQEAVGRYAGSAGLAFGYGYSNIRLLGAGTIGTKVASTAFEDIIKSQVVRNVAKNVGIYAGTGAGINIGVGAIEGQTSQNEILQNAYSGAKFGITYGPILGGISRGVEIGASKIVGKIPIIVPESLLLSSSEIVASKSPLGVNYGPIGIKPLSEVVQSAPPIIQGAGRVLGSGITNAAINAGFSFGTGASTNSTLANTAIGFAIPFAFKGSEIAGRYTFFPRGTNTKPELENVIINYKEPLTTEKGINIGQIAELSQNTPSSFLRQIGATEYVWSGISNPDNFYFIGSEGKYAYSINPQIKVKNPILENIARLAYGQKASYEALGSNQFNIKAKPMITNAEVSARLEPQLEQLFYGGKKYNILNAQRTFIPFEQISYFTGGKGTRYEIRTPQSEAGISEFLTTKEGTEEIPIIKSTLVGGTAPFTVTKITTNRFRDILKLGEYRKVINLGESPLVPKLNFNIKGQKIASPQSLLEVTAPDPKTLIGKNYFLEQLTNIEEPRIGLESAYKGEESFPFKNFADLGYSGIRTKADIFKIEAGFRGMKIWSPLSSKQEFLIETNKIPVKQVNRFTSGGYKVEEIGTLGTIPGIYRVGKEITKYKPGATIEMFENTNMSLNEILSAKIKPPSQEAFIRLSEFGKQLKSFGPTWNLEEEIVPKISEPYENISEISNRNAYIPYIKYFRLSSPEYKAPSFSKPEKNLPSSVFETLPEFKSPPSFSKPEKNLPSSVFESQNLREKTISLNLNKPENIKTQTTKAFMSPSTAIFSETIKMPKYNYEAQFEPNIKSKTIPIFAGNSLVNPNQTNLSAIPINQEINKVASSISSSSGTKVGGEPINIETSQIKPQKQRLNQIAQVPASIAIPKTEPTIFKFQPEVFKSYPTYKYPEVQTNPYLYEQLYPYYSKEKEENALKETERWKNKEKFDEIYKIYESEKSFEKEAEKQTQKEKEVEKQIQKQIQKTIPIPITKITEFKPIEPPPRREGGELFTSTKNLNVALGTFKDYNPSLIALSYPEREKQFESTYVEALKGFEIRPLRVPKAKIKA